MKLTWTLIQFPPIEILFDSLLSSTDLAHKAYYSSYNARTSLAYSSRAQQGDTIVATDISDKFSFSGLLAYLESHVPASGTLL
jgi:hypothetical protein